MSEKNLEGMINISLEKVKGMVDSNSIIGSPIFTPDGTTIIPVSKVSIGFGCGGSDFPSASPKEMFGGGTGGGVTITPIAFLVTSGDSVKVMQLDTIGSTADNMVRSIPEILDKISELTGKKKSE